MKQSHTPMYRHALRLFFLLCALAVVFFPEEAGAVLQVKNPGTGRTPKRSTPGSSSSSSTPKRVNKHRAIYLDGANITLSDAGEGKTTITSDTETLTSDLSNVCIYAGSLDADVSASTTITMTGGSVGAIFAGGYAADMSVTRSGNVTITISGGRIGYVSAGGEAYDATYESKVTGNVIITLYDCEYCGTSYINEDDQNTFNPANVEVYDFSTHLSLYDPNTSVTTAPRWSKTAPGLSRYVVQDGSGSLSAGGMVTIPSVIDYKCSHVTLATGANVDCLGHIHMDDCSVTAVQGLGTWSGQALRIPHAISQDISGKTETHHSQRCTKCGYAVETKHVWKYLESTSTADALSKGHTRVCAICGYSEVEACTIVKTFVGASAGHNIECKVCRHIFGTEAHTVGNPGNNLVYCTGCNTTYEEEKPKICQIGETLYTSVDDAVEAAADGATIQLTTDINVTRTIEVELGTRTVTLDMCGHSITLTASASNVCAETLRLVSGTLHIVNSASQTVPYAALACNTDYGSLQVKAGASLSVTGCYLSLLNINATDQGHITLGQNQIEVLKVHSKDHYTLTGLNTITSSFVGYAHSGNDVLPTGIILREEQSDGVWQTYFNHASTATGNLVAGPYFHTHVVELGPCTEHKLLSGTPTANGHQGLCISCGQSVGMAHDMTAVGDSKDAHLHYLKCAICGHQSETLTAMHDYSGQGGKCKGCDAQPAVARHTEGSDVINYYGTFESAWAAANVPQTTDTLILLQDVSFSTPLTFTSIADQNGYYYPYIIVKGQDKTLSYTGSGSAVTYPEDPTADPLSLELGLLLSGEWPEKAAQVGCVIGSGLVQMHTDHQYEYVHDTDNGKELSTHTATCTVCGYSKHQNHDYQSSANCSQCTVARVIVAKVTADGLTEAQCGSITEAWDKAIEYSTGDNQGKVATIQMQAHADLYDELSLDVDANIIFDGANYKIYVCGEIDNIFSVGTKGHLTITGGQFQSTHHVVLDSGRGGVVQLKGGTYLKGTAASVSNADALCANYYKNYGRIVPLASLADMIAPGYVLTASDDNYFGDIHRGEVVNLNTPESVVSVSGTVTACQHTLANLPVTAAQSADCTHAGNIHYAYCADCGAYVDLDHNNNLLSASGVFSAALGHDFGADGKCTRCGQSSSVVILTNEEGEVKGSYDNFRDAWNYVAEENYLGSTLTFTIQEDYAQHPDQTSEYPDFFNTINTSYDIVVDLNGHTLDLQGYTLGLYTDKSLTVTDSQKAGKTLTANIHQTYSGSHVIINDVIVSAQDLKAEDLALRGSSGVQLTSDEAELYTLWMDENCYLEGNGAKQLKMMPVYDSASEQNVNDPNDCMADLMHNVYTKGSQNTDVKCHTTTSLRDNGGNPELTLYVKNPDDEDVTSWRAVKTSDPVVHDYPSITDNGQTHGGTCRSCGFTTHESHDFVNHRCLVCGHIAEATLIADDISTDYAYFDDAFNAAQYMKSTLIVNRDFESSNNHWVEAEDTDLTLDLNGHTISLWYTPYLTKGKLTIKDDTGMGKIHAIMNQSHALYVSNSSDADPTLIIKGGQLIGDEGYDYDNNYYKSAGLFVYGGVASSAGGSGSHIYLEGGTYSRIATNVGEAAEFNAMDLLATDCFYVDATTGETKSNIKKESSLWNTTSIDNVRVYNPAQKITTGSTLNVSDQTTPAGAAARAPKRASETELNELLSRVTDNLLVNTFMATGLETVVDICDNTIASALQQAANKAGKVLNVTTDTDISAYIKAELKAVTIENVTVDENTVKVLSKLTFDVKPYAETTLADGTRIAAVIGNSLIGSDVTFRLPVDPQLNAEKLDIYHKSDEQLAEPVLLARLTVQQQNIGTEAAPNIQKYVDVQTSSFSEFSYQMVTTFTLVDGTAYTGAEEKTFSELSYTRDFTRADVNAWQTWFVPMNYQVGSTADYDFAKIVTMVYLDSNGQIAVDLSGSESLVLVVTKYAEGDIVPGGVPALVRKNVSGHDEATFASSDGKLLSATDVQQLSASTTTDNYSFTGTYQTCKPSLYWYTLSVAGRLTRITKETTELKPYRWYHKRVSKSANGGGSSAPIRIITMGEDDGTVDIQSIIANQPQVTSAYDLQGRRVDQMGRGLYLSNGKKVYNQ